MKTVLVCGVQAPFITGGAEILVSELRANLERRGFRADVVERALQVVSRLRARAAGPGLAPPRRDGEQRHAGGPRDPHQVPELPRAPPAQGGVAVPPAPRGLRPLRHPVLLVHATPRRTARCARPSTPWTTPRSASAARSTPSRATWPTACRATTACPARRCTRRRTTWAATATTGYGDYLFYAGRLDRLKRLDLAIDAMKRVRGGARLKIAGTGPLAEELRKQIVGLGVEDRVELLGFVDADDLIDLYAGCRAAYYAPLNEDYGYVTVEAFLSQQAGGHHHRRRRAAGVRDRRRDRASSRSRSRRRIAAAIDRLWALPQARLARDGRGGPRARRGHHLGPRHRPPHGVAP